MPYECAEQRNQSELPRIWQLGADFFVQADHTSPLARAMDVVFGAFALQKDHAVATERARLSARQRNGTWDVAINGVSIVNACREAEMAPLIEAALTDAAVRMRGGRIAFHAAAVVVAGQTVLHVAHKGSGKSTLSAWFGDHDGIYCGDEVAFVCPDDHRVEPFPKAATLKRGSFSLFPDSPTHDDPIRGSLRYHLPRQWALDDLLPPPVLLVFPRYDSDAESSAIAELSPEETALALVQQTFGGLERDSRTMDCIANLAGIPSFEVAYSRAEDAAAAIRDLLGE